MKKRLLEIAFIVAIVVLLVSCSDKEEAVSESAIEESVLETESSEAFSEVEEETREESSEQVTEAVKEENLEEPTEKLVGEGHDFRNSDWGDALNQVIAAETEITKGFKTNSDSGYFGYTGDIQMEELEDAPINVMYFFNPEGKLICGIYTITYSELNNDILSLAVSNMNVFLDMARELTGESGESIFIEADGIIIRPDSDDRGIDLSEGKSFGYYFPKNCILIQLDPFVEHPTLQLQFNGGWADEWKEMHGVSEWSY